MIGVDSTTAEALAWADNALALTSKTPRLDAEVLLAFTSGRSRTSLLADGDQKLLAEKAARYQVIVSKRKSGVPVAYLTGFKEFWSIDFQITQDVLIPRPDTEVLVERALQYIPENGTVADLGTGSGAIALALASERPDAVITATEVCAKALLLARQNRDRLGYSTVRLVQSDWFENLEGEKFDLIVSNPPYIDPEDSHLKALVYEPRQALVATDNGLSDLTILVTKSRDYLRQNGWLLLEHGWQQGEAVRALLEQHRYTNVQTISDLEARPRVTEGRC